MINKVTDALLGVSVGDAVGVPFEFRKRDEMLSNHATGMVGYGTYNLPMGTWSDDSSLTFCLAESLINGYDLKDISERFIRWKEEAYWTANGRVFDIGITTSAAISRLKRIIEDNNSEWLKNLKNHREINENGNGSLMRIIPLLFYIKGLPIEKQFDIVWELSALTHRHIIAAMSCMIYLKFAEKLLSEMDKDLAYAETRKEILEFWAEIYFPETESIYFNKLIQQDIRTVKIDDLRSGGFVIEVLESSFWFFLNESSYENTILSIINIGHDTDTSAAIAGGLAGIYYGRKGIPEHWVNSLARLNDILVLAEKLNNKYCI